jgi:hypothetical protein
MAEVALSPEPAPSGVVMSTNTWVGSPPTKLRFVVSMATTVWLSNWLRTSDCTRSMGRTLEPRASLKGLSTITTSPRR